jgi:N-acetylglutamate synthase-like GNAT family acetyltransferase
MKFKLITPHAPEYLAERLLRWEVLAKPYGMPPGSEAQQEEMQSLHLIALHGKKLVGCICFNAEDARSGRVFAMAVSEEYQGRAFGRKLIQTLEEQLILRNICDVYLYTRPETEEFYSLMGYRPEGDGIVQMGILQKMMKKKLRVEHVLKP